MQRVGVSGAQAMRVATNTRTYAPRSLARWGLRSGQSTSQVSRACSGAAGKEEMDLDNPPKLGDEIEANYPIDPKDMELDDQTREVVDKFLKLNIIQVSMWRKAVFNAMGVDPEMAMMVGAGGGGGAPAEAAEAAPEKTEFNVKLASFDSGSKIKIIKEVRAITGLGLKEAKAAVEAAPTVLKESLTKEEAEELVAKLKEVGGVCEIE